jgi:hypothetical protein
MTFIEACDLIDQEVNKIKKKDMFGEQNSGMMVMPYIYKILGDRFDQPQVDLQNGLISIEEYAKRMIALIREVDCRHQEKQITKKIHNLGLDQTELDLI